MSTEKIMEQAQVFASAWSVVGGPFDGGDAMEVATQEKDELRRMVAELVEERDALAAKLKDAKHDRDEFRRVMNGFAEKMAELEGQKPVQLDEPDYHWEAMGCGLEDRNITDRYEAMKHGWDCAMDRMFEQISEPLYARPVPAEMSPDFTDTARSALLWVLWHHQGGSSPVGQPIRYALGMDAHEHLSKHQVQEAKRWAALTKSESNDFRQARTAPTEFVNARLLEAQKEKSK